MKEMKAPDKVTQKMTHDGAVTENLATGEVTNISGREAETDLSADREPLQTAEAVAERAAHAHDRHKAKQADRADAETVRRIGGQGAALPPGCNSRTRNWKPRICGKRSGALTGRRISWTPAKEAIPTRKVLKTGRVFDEAAGKGKTRLRFEEVEKKPNGHLRHNPLSRPVQELKATAHGEVRKVEQENVGVEAGHKGEEPGGARCGSCGERCSFRWSGSAA